MSGSLTFFLVANDYWFVPVPTDKDLVISSKDGTYIYKLKKILESKNITDFLCLLL